MCCETLSTLPERQMHKYCRSKRLTWDVLNDINLGRSMKYYKRVSHFKCREKELDITRGSG